MIAHLLGKITEKYDNSVIVDVHGVGYELMLSTPDFEAANLDAEVKYYTYHAVRENSEELYGFTSLAAKKMFQLLISVQGIGPKAAIAILSLGSAEDVRNAIANADSAYVAKASGVGKKSAERVIVDLRDKVGIPSHVGASTPIPKPQSDAPDEALDALIALGFSLKEATTALAEIDPSLDTSTRVREALQKR